MLKFDSLVIIGIVLIFVAGMANGVHETIHYHYPAFKKKYPEANDLYWNPMESWKSKYENFPEDKSAKFFGSKTFFVFLTDAKHLFAEIYRQFIFIGGLMIGLSITRKSLWIPVIYFAIGYIVQAVGFHLIYTIYF